MANKGFSLTHDMLHDLIISMLCARAASTSRNHPTTSAGSNDTDAGNKLLLGKNWTYQFSKSTQTISRSISYYHLTLSMVRLLTQTPMLLRELI